jgi:hypothetical protein
VEGWAVSAISRRHFLGATAPIATGVAGNTWRTSGDLIVTSALPPSQAVATTNQLLSGALPQIDGYEVLEGSLILLTAQGIGSQNGPWIAHAAGWVRPSFYPSGGSVIGCLVPVGGGNTYASTVWQMAATTAATIDATATKWSLVGPTVGTNPAILQRLTIAQPRAGSDWSYTIPSGTWQRLLTAAGTLTTSSVTANRYAGLRILDSRGTRIGEMQETSAVTASVVQKVTYSRSINWNQGGTAGDDLRTVAVTIPALILLPGYQIQSVTPNLQSGDRYSAIQVLCELWNTLPLFDVPGPMLT